MFIRSLQALLIVTCLSSAYADVNNEYQDPFYVGLGVGLSFLEPVSNSVALTLTEDSDFAYKVFAGYAVDERWSIEAFWANLGNAQLGSTGTTIDIEYKAFGVGGLYYYPLNNRWRVFAKAGVGRLSNKALGVALERIEDNFIYAGAGITWNMVGTWDLRAEYEYFDTDAQLLSFNVIKRFGSETSRRIKKLENKIDEQEKLLTASFIAAVAKKQPECGIYAVELKGVIFESRSIALTVESKKAIDSIVDKLRVLPQDIRFELRAHTDDTGTETYNYNLSLARARNVRDYFAEKGITLHRIDAQGYGEWRPRDANETTAGRYQNRRAELVLLGVEKYVDDTSSCPQHTSKPVMQ